LEGATKLCHLAKENSPSILCDFGHRKLSRKHFEYFLEKEQTIHALPMFDFPILATLPSRVIHSYVRCTKVISKPSPDCSLPLKIATPTSTDASVEIEESFSSNLMDPLSKSLMILLLMLSVLPKLFLTPMTVAFIVLWTCAQKVIAFRFIAHFSHQVQCMTTLDTWRILRKKSFSVRMPMMPMMIPSA